MKKILTVLFVVIVAIAFAGAAVAGKVPTPTEAPAGVKIVNADHAKSLIESKEAVAFDMRKALNYGKGHLPHAVSLPYKWTKKGHPAQREGTFDMSKLPADKNKSILFHSDGPNGWKSYYASKAAVEAGYKNVMWLRDGFSSWSEKGYKVEH